MPSLYLRTIAVAAVAAPCIGFAQIDSPPPFADDAFLEIADRVAEIESLHGANSRDLIEPLTELASAYEDRGADEPALAVIERAKQVIRVNDGLHSLDEVPLSKQAIRIEEARGNAKVAWRDEQALLALVRRHPHDLRTAQTLNEIADKRMAMLARFEAGEFPPQVALGCYYSEWVFDQRTKMYRRGGCRSGNRYTAVNAIRAQANAYGIEAANIVVRRARWVDSPCVRPETPAATGDGRISRRDARAQGAESLRAWSDYASCLEVKYEHAESTNAPPEDLAQLAEDRSSAVRELEERRAAYEERFGPVRAPVCPGDVFPPQMLRSLSQIACVHH
jgi:hypothetical protein